MSSQTDAAIDRDLPPSSGKPKREPIPVTLAGTPIVREEYNFNNPRRGRCLIINNRNFAPHTGQQEREGTDFDASSCEKLFMHLGFEVERVDNLGYMDMRRKLREVSEEDHSDADCFACVILSHGREGSVYGTDGTMNIDAITANFKGDVCESLAGKPKLFFIQACRGTKFDHGVEVLEDRPDTGVDDTDAAVDNPSMRKIPAEADFLMAFSVVPGYFSWRNNVDGSWFIQGLCYVLLEHAETMELMQMMTLVNKIVAYDFASCTDHEWTDNMKQVPCMMSMLTKEVYFRQK